MIQRIGRRGAYLLFLAILDLTYAHGLFFPTERAASSPTYVFLAEIFPLHMWAILWAVCGFICLIYSFKKTDAPGFTAAIFIKTIWALISLLGWLFGDIERGYISAAIWLLFVGVTGLIATWPEYIKVKVK